MSTDMSLWAFFHSSPLLLLSWVPISQVLTLNKDLTATPSSIQQTDKLLQIILSPTSERDSTVSVMIKSMDLGLRAPGSNHRWATCASHYKAFSASYFFASVQWRCWSFLSHRVIMKMKVVDICKAFRTVPAQGMFVFAIISLPFYFHFPWVPLLITILENASLLWHPLTLTHPLASPLFFTKLDLSYRSTAATPSITAIAYIPLPRYFSLLIVICPHIYQSAHCGLTMITCTMWLLTLVDFNS